MFKFNAAHEYWAVPVWEPHRYKLSFASTLGQLCYNRIGQGCTEGPETYTHLKDIATGEIPAAMRCLLSHQSEEESVGNESTFTATDRVRCCRQTLVSGSLRVACLRE